MIKEKRMIDWSYHPFLGGPRKCLGGEFSLFSVIQKEEFHNFTNSFGDWDRTIRHYSSKILDMSGFTAL